MRKAIVLIILLFVTFTQAQEISVASFKMLENDLTANTTGTMERDQNGEIAALIKVVTSEQGFVFDGGMVGVVKTKQEVGEVWVYVPHGIKRITVKHPTLGILRDYYFPIPVEKARTYEMKLTTGRVETIVTHTVNKQFVIFNVTPANAVVELDDELLMVDSEGYAEKSVPLGTYNYRVSCPNYHTEAGQVTVTKEGKAEVNVTLRPNFGAIKFSGDEEYHGAHIFIDNERVGQLPVTVASSKVGEHQVRIMKPLYKTYTSVVTVAANDTVELDVSLVPNFAKVKVVSADDQGEIWIDGKQMGTGTWDGRLEVGEYKVEVKKKGYRTVSDVLSIYDLTERTFRMGALVQAFASVEISSRPSKAKVYMDGEMVGETPLVKSGVPVGEHLIRFERDGYRSVEKTVELKENEENRVMVELVEGKDDKNDKGKAAEDTPTAGPANRKRAKADVAKTEPGRGWRVVAGAGAEYSSYGLGYGAELGLDINRFSLLAGVGNYKMGEYTAHYGKAGYYNGESVTNPIELLRFTAKMGYSLSLGRHFRITPQVGLLFGPSCLKGKEYLTGEVLEWKEIPTNDYSGLVLPPDAEYMEMNSRIEQFVGIQYGCIFGARFELLAIKSRLGIHVTPEYVLGEGVAVSAGLSVRF